jgi:hypothetical protein
MLAGGMFVTCAAALLTLIVLRAVVGEFSLAERILMPLLFAVFVTTPIMLLGLGVWTLTEFAHVPEGLWSAAKAGSPWWVRRAIVNGVPLDWPDEMGETALMQASANGRIEVVKLLLLHGADTQVRNPFGQTALEIAWAKGHTDIVALLQKYDAAPRPAPPASGPVSRPRVRPWLLGAALLGALLVVGWLWFYDPYPTEISFPEFAHLANEKQVKSVTLYGKCLKGEVKAPHEHPQLHGGRFVAPVPDQLQLGSVLQNLRNRDPGVQITQVSGSSADRWPGAWVIIPMLAVPLAVAGLIGWPIGSPYWFPHLRPARAGRTPGRQA